MENPFEILNDRITRLEAMMAKTIALIEALHDQQPQQPATYDRRKPATRMLAADYLGVSVGTVDNLVRSNQLKSCKVGKAVRFRWESLDEFISTRNN